MIRKIFRASGMVLLLLVLAWAGTGLYFRIADAGPWPAREATQPSGLFKREDTCWRGGGWDEWQATLRNMNGSWNPLGWILMKRFPRADYDAGHAAVDCRWVVYESDGFDVGGYVLMPRDVKPGERLPVLVYNRGGNGSFGQMVFAAALYFLVPYAEEGFLVVASNYRGADDGDPEKSGMDEFGGVEVRDVERLIELTAQLPQADMDNLFMLGGSRGTMMNYLIARRDHRFRAIASINGPNDLESELKFRPEMEQVYVARIPDYATRRSEVLAQRSVMHWAEELPRTTPILLLHGGRDWRVDPQNGPRLKARLDAIGHPNKLVMYPEDDHNLAANADRAKDEIVAWFRAHARKEADATVPTRPATVEADATGTSAAPST